MLTDRGAARLVVVTANLTAAAFGFATVNLGGFHPAAIVASPVTGTIGWLVGRWAGHRLGDRLIRAGYARAGQPVYRLRSLPPGETTAGGKARALARLLRAGQRVPDGVVVLPRAFAGDHLDPAAAAALQAELRRFRAGERFAVRSSAAAEDSAAASFAGAYETVLDVPADSVVAAIARVRASAGADRVSTYSEATGAPSGDVAVVVQVMVPAQQAGVLFTVHPLTGDLDTMLGTVVAGLGESLVSGDETGEQFTLARPGGGYTGPESLRRFAGALHAEAHRIEGTFGGVPQDLEWAVADDKVWILQARPITTLSPWRPDSAEFNDSYAGNCLWSATNLSEANPEAQTPLTVSLVRYQQANGGPSMALRGREMAGHIGGRPYANLTVQITSRRGEAAKEDPRAVYRKLADWWGDLPSQVPVPVLPLTAEDWTRAGVPLLGSLARLGWARLRLRAFLATHQVRCDDLTAKIAASPAPADLLRVWDGELFEFSLRSFWAVIASGSSSPARLEGRLREEFGAELAAALVSNLSGLAGELESLGPAAGLGEVAAGRMPAAEYVARFGHRGVNEVELAWPRPVEDPEWLPGMLARTGEAPDVITLRRRQQETFDAALGQIAQRDRRAARRVHRQLSRAAKQAALRESVRSEGVRTTWVMRRFALRAGELLGIGEDVFLLTIEELLAALGGETTAFGRFDLRRETYLRYRELPALPGLIVGRFDPFAWAADPHRRTDVFVAGAEPTADVEPAAAHLVTGHPGASGRVEGRVRRLDRFQDADQLLPGEILVTQLTNIGWTPLFPRAGGIVTDLGAPLSHAAIVARELGIPAVVGCGDATSRLHTGDLVAIDGAAGRVTILDRAGAGASVTS